MMKAENLLKLTSSVGEVVTKYMQASAQEYLQASQDVLKDYEKRAKEISDLWEQNIGLGTGAVINPLDFTESAGTYVTETRDAYLQRTLMTGSDIVEISLKMIERFVENTTNIELPI